MARLIYSAITSLDLYLADAAGNFDWAAPSDEVHAYVNDLERPIGTYLYGRRMYDVMAYWAGAPTYGDPPSAGQDFAAIWQAADKIVYSRTLEETTTPRTRLERSFDVDAVQRLKDTAAQDISVGGADLAAQAIGAGLVDECHLFLTPVLLGGGRAALPDDVRVPLELVDERRFGDGVVHLHYRVTT